MFYMILAHFYVVAHSSQSQKQAYFSSLCDSGS